jgi:hypothetical protein
VLHDLLGIDVTVDRSVFVRRPGKIGVHGARRDEEVVGRVDEVDGSTHDARQVAGDVDDSVPRSPLECLEVAVAVSAELLDVREQVGIRVSAIEERDIVPDRERRVDDRAAEELRPAEDQKADRASSRRSTSSSVL